jgi:hypothetical protein
MITFEHLDDLLSFLESNPDKFVSWFDDEADAYVACERLPIPPELKNVKKLPASVANLQAWLDMHND